MMKQYISNWSVCCAFIAEHKVKDDYENLSFGRKIIWRLIALDIFINMLTGGDPRETISSSIHKDRKSSVFAGFLINVIESVDDDHGEIANQPHFGEGSDDNRELPGMSRIFVIIMVLIAITIPILILVRS